MINGRFTTRNRGEKTALCNCRCSNQCVGANDKLYGTQLIFDSEYILVIWAPGYWCGDSLFWSPFPISFLAIDISLGRTFSNPCGSQYPKKATLISLPLHACAFACPYASQALECEEVFWRLHVSFYKTSSVLSRCMGPQRNLKNKQTWDIASALKLGNLKKNGLTTRLEP